MKNKFLSETAYKTYGRLTRYGDGGKARKIISKLIVKAIRSQLEQLPKTAVEAVLNALPTHQWRTSYITGLDIAHNSVAQEVDVFDYKAPTLVSNKDPAAFPSTLQPLLTYDPNTDTYYLEAYAPSIPDATLASFGKMLLSAQDDCQGSRPPLIPYRVDTPQRSLWMPGDQGTLQWQVADSGPNINTGGSNYSPVVGQKFEVRDTNPPALIAPPSKVVETSTASASVQLGSPRAFDLADLTPAVSNDVNNDPSVSVDFDLGIHTVTWTATDEAGNKTSKEQLINVKNQGTNTAPVGNDQTVDAVSYKPVDIILTGFDADTDPNTGRHDPLNFTIKDKPTNGFFVAPLLPYFIDDFRLDKSASRFAGDLKQTDPTGYCNTIKNDSWKMLYPYNASWITVDDDGTTVVYDQGNMICADQGIDLANAHRLAMFDVDGNFVRQVTTGDIYVNAVYMNWRTKGIYIAYNTDPGTGDIVYYDKNFNNLGSFSTTGRSNSDENVANPKAISADNQGIVYIANANQIAAYQGPTSATALTSNNSYKFLGMLATINDVNITGTIKSMATDSQNNLYISMDNRVLKYAASTNSTDSATGQVTFVPGAFIGWMGRCDSNLTNTYACDTVNRRSIGFSCTDTLCGVSGGISTGADPGQFNDTRGLAVDPHDILYVSDYNNSRIERFTPEGDFAGQAKSTGAGYGFILGDFGNPVNITVNSDHLYILNGYLLHSLKTTPVTPIDDSSAKVTYQSNNNFVGADIFTFNTSDGLATGAGTVTVNVERNYRPPVISVPPSYTLNEDGSVNVTLVGSDPDGSLDTLSYSVVTPPAHGSLSGSGANVIYTPDANYNGTDSFTYLVSDGVYQSAPATVALTITSVEDPPQATVPATDNEGLGYKFHFPVDVFDPDADETHMVTIDWGDGSPLDHDGVIEDKDGKVISGDYIQDDGTLPDGLQATGPLLNLDSDGNGTVTFEHAYTVPGDHLANICVTDNVQILSDGTKQATADSQSRCAQTTITVTLFAYLQLYLVPDADHADPGATDPFTVTVTNRPFDVDVPGYSKGLDAANVSVTGKNGNGLTMSQITPSQGSCTLDQGNFDCSVGALAAGASATIKIATALDGLAPGNALLTLNANRQTDSVAALEDDAIGVVQVNTSGKPPQIQSLNVTLGPTAGGTALTVTGHDFDANADVLFDNVPAGDVDVVDANTITLTTPAHLAGAVDVVVVNSDNQSATLATSFQYSDVAAVSSSGNPASSGGGSGSGGGGGGGSLDPSSLVVLSLFSTLAWMRHRRMARKHRQT